MPGDHPRFRRQPHTAPKLQRLVSDEVRRRQNLGILILRIPQADSDQSPFSGPVQARSTRRQIELFNRRHGSHRIVSVAKLFSQAGEEQQDGETGRRVFQLDSNQSQDESTGNTGNGGDMLALRRSASNRSEHEFGQCPMSKCLAESGEIS